MRVVRACAPFLKHPTPRRDIAPKKCGGNDHPTENYERAQEPSRKTRVFRLIQGNRKTRSTALEVLYHGSLRETDKKVPFFTQSERTFWKFPGIHSSVFSIILRHLHRSKSRAKYAKRGQNQR